MGEMRIEKGPTSGLCSVCFKRKELVLCPSTFLIYTDIPFSILSAAESSLHGGKMQNPGGAVTLQEPSFHGFKQTKDI